MDMLENIQKILIALLAFKMLLNFLFPYTLVWQLIRSKKERTESVSIMPIVEVILSIVVILCAVMIDGDRWNQDAVKLLMIIALTGLGSILHFVLVGFLGGAFASFLSKRRK